MRSSEHFNLNLVEGTDPVNPLTQDVPNYETIDSTLYANQTDNIGTAVELTSGTVHTLTRVHSNQNCFRFTATSNFTAGETFTVDGSQVTALLPSGETLGTGAYIIGSEVICCLRDTLLTVFTNGGTVAVASDSEKLGGELPEYYGTAADVSAAASTASAAGTLAQQNASAITTINQSLSVINQKLDNRGTSTLLGSGTSGTISLNDDMSNYKYLCVYGAVLYNPVMIPVDLFISFKQARYTYKGYVYSAELTYLSNTSVSVAQDGSYSPTISIYGIK